MVAADAKPERRSSRGFAGQGFGRALCHDDRERDAFFLEAGRESRPWSRRREECENERLRQRSPRTKLSTRPTATAARGPCRPRMFPRAIARSRSSTSAATRSSTSPSVAHPPTSSRSSPRGSPPAASSERRRFPPRTSLFAARRRPRQISGASGGGRGTRVLPSMAQSLASVEGAPARRGRYGSRPRGGA